MITLKRLYQLTTGDLGTHQRTIDAQFRQLEPHRQKIVRARLQGLSLANIANQVGHDCSPGTIHDHIHRAMEAIRKAVHGEPRYNRIGRRHQPPKPAAPSSFMEPGQPAAPLHTARAALAQLAAGSGRRRRPRQK